MAAGLAMLSRLSHCPRSTNIVSPSRHRSFATSSAGDNFFRRVFSRKKKEYDPRVKTVVTRHERYARGFVFATYGIFFFFLFIPGSNYSVKKSLNEQFFAENAKKPGMMSLDCGVQYKVLKKGYGEKPKNRASSVYVHYQGSLLDGTIFTSTKHLDKAIQFDLNSVIPGLSQCIFNMHIGEERQVFIPSHLAYARNGKLNNDSFVNIPPNTPIMFNVQLCGFD